MRYRAAVAMAATEDKARATGPFHSPNKTTPRSYLIGNATLQVYMESASEPPPCIPCLQVNKARKALSAFSKCAVKFLDPSFLEAIQAQETRGWVDRSLFPEGTRNLNLSQALDPFPSLPLLSEFLWNASPPAALLLISCSASVVG